MNHLSGSSCSTRKRDKKVAVHQAKLKPAWQLFTELFTPSRLYLQSKSRKYFWLDIPDEFQEELSIEDIDHLFDVLDNAPMNTIATTGMFASNIVKWSFYQQNCFRYETEMHYRLLQRMVGHCFITQQTVLNTIHLMNTLHYSTQEYGRDTLTWLLDNVTGGLLAVRLIVPPYEWLVDDDQFRQRLLPSPDSVDMKKRQKVQSGMVALLKDNPALMEISSQCLMLYYLF